MVLSRIPTRARTRLLTDFAAVGWSGSDVLYALEHHPDGTPHRHTHRVRRPYAWARHRLTLWRRPDGAPAASHWDQLCAELPSPPTRSTPLSRALAITGGTGEEVSAI
ncbi:hypothetical protein AN218_12445 [Streptomyces nanshensis]|uniref:Uncharacterized protein n=1 Tax=Streptomyces nanshensis TaxID=518642 RepID=A0A1E7L5T2_9ACTN|nr:hypothetical protein AN218_12445 [Streptomyces nanshensis]